ncbi:cobalamin B12-binding domain-containing protein [Mucisphaera calidilacus]|uniref:B12 binding domain protein n=1 Tax=Mucisphaera calidilacus TaxID=2527982 RepID=A0A518BWU1_9BACT|nr:B12-binding domain-containing protein [Mucisphaera calidilacus]QDU71404.1 B12 binding domain protein [Mucisphaera calidilacus]
MPSERHISIERFFSFLISGDRRQAHSLVDEALEGVNDPVEIIANLIWPCLEQLHKLNREDQLTNLAYHYATRLLHQVIDQIQPKLPSRGRRNQRILLTCGDELLEELAAQLATDLLEADGYDVFLAGGGVANDEIVEELGSINANRLVVFGVIPATVPQTRQLIDRLHDIGVCPNLQIIVGGGVFNRAEGLAEEIGADLWALDPIELVEVIDEEPERRMIPEQRTVGRRRKPTGRNAA